MGEGRGPVVGAECGQIDGPCGLLDIVVCVHRLVPSTCSMKARLSHVVHAGIIASGDCSGLGCCIGKQIVLHTILRSKHVRTTVPVLLCCEGSAWPGLATLGAG